MELSSIPVILYLLLVKAMSLVDAVTVHYLHWNTSNPIFRIDNTDHIVDVNQGNLPWEYDQLNIICPSYLGNRGGTISEQDTPERYIIYNVSREEYDSCRISQSDPRVVAVCDKPDKQLQFTITFRSFSPTPRGLEFRPGQDYYFISTSSTKDLHRRVGGSCSTHNMKVIFKIAQNSEHSKPSGPSINVPRSLTTSEDQSISENMGYKDILRPIEDVRSFHSGLDQITKGRYDRDHNNVVKQEASTMTGSSSSSSPSLLSFSVFPVILSFLLSSAMILQQQQL
jgi:hypothetical protein